MKNREEIERSYIQCGPFSKQRKSLKCSPQAKLNAALAAQFTQACEINASIDGTHLKEKALHIMFPLGIANVLASTGWNDGFKTRCNIVCRTRVR
jgi:hypothetical protein